MINIEQYREQIIKRAADNNNVSILVPRKTEVEIVFLLNTDNT